MCPFCGECDSVYKVDKKNGSGSSPSAFVKCGRCTAIAPYSTWNNRKLKMNSSIRDQLIKFMRRINSEVDDCEIPDVVENWVINNSIHHQCDSDVEILELRKRLIEINDNARNIINKMGDALRNK